MPNVTTFYPRSEISLERGLLDYTTCHIVNLLAVYLVI